MKEMSSSGQFGVNCEPIESGVCQATIWIYRIAPTILLAVGTVGNPINIFVLSRKKIRATPCFLLVFLAFFDLLYLWSVFLQNPLRIGFDINIKTVSEIFCKLHTWMSLWSGAASIWTVAIFTVERMMFTLFPHNTAMHLNRNKSIILMWAIFILIGAIIAIFIGGDWWTGSDVISNTTNQTTSQCYMAGIIDDALFTKWQIVVLLLCLMIPFVVIISGNITLIIHFYRRRRTGTSTDSQTVLLFLITGLMVFTIVPLGINAITIRVLSGFVDQSSPMLMLLNSLTYVLIMCNFSLNFFCYAWKGTLFKQECKEIWGSIKTIKPFSNCNF